MVVDANEPFDQVHTIQAFQDHTHAFVFYSIVLKDYGIDVVGELCERFLKCGALFGLQEVSLQVKGFFVSFLEDTQYRYFVLLTLFEE